MTRPAATRRGTIAQRGETPEKHGYGSPNERKYKALVNPSENRDRPQMTRSGGPRQKHHILSGAQFKQAVAQRARQADK